MSYFHTGVINKQHDKVSDIDRYFWCAKLFWGRRGRMCDRMVVECTLTYAISAYHH
jgi:hypothetical protein